MTGVLDPDREIPGEEADPLLGRAASALAEDACARPGDEELLTRAVASAMRSSPAVPLATRRPTRVRTWMLAAAVAVTLAGLASAALWSASDARHPSGSVPQIPAVAAPTPASPPAPTSLPETPTAEEPSSPLEPPAPERSVAASPPATAAGLFAAANDARRSRDPKTAALYRDLQRRFPGSPEARLSEVTLGRLYLDTQDDAKSALEQFDAYLGPGSGPLREEAMVGRALALMRLGEHAEERAAWRKLLEEYPDSLSADRAKQRLGELP
jgi:TolA-binding protein